MPKSRSLLELLLLIAVVACAMAVLQEKTKTPDQAVLARGPAEIALSQAIQAYGKGQFAVCRERCEEVFKTAPEDLIAMRYKGMALAREGKLEAAKVEFTRAINSVQNPIARVLYSIRLDLLHLERARCEIERQEYDEAIADANPVCHPDEARAAVDGQVNYKLIAEAFSVLGVARAGKKDYQQALNDIQEGRIFQVVDPRHLLVNLVTKAEIPPNPVQEKHIAILQRLLGDSEERPDPTVTHPGFCPLCSHKF